MTLQQASSKSSKQEVAAPPELEAKGAVLSKQEAESALKRASSDEQVSVMQQAPVLNRRRPCESRHRR
jgi:hypothetical protein